MPTIDLNCDLGEGFPHDTELMTLISSANVACGMHAGDPGIMLATMLEAARCGVRVGAHPSLPDRRNFGRSEVSRSRPDILADCLYQIGGLQAVGAIASVRVAYLKPHGALYNMACRDEETADPVVSAAAHFHLPVMGLPDSALERLAAERGLGFIREGFADRRYQPDGSLVPRDRPDALIAEPEEAVAQAERLADRGIHSLCVHGDNPKAVEFVRTLRARLEARGFTIAATPSGLKA